MLTIIYSEKGVSNPDSKSRSLAKEIFAEGNDYETSTESLIDAFRVMVFKKEITKDAIQFKYNNEILTVNHLGQVSSYPNGFCDARDDLLDELLGLA